MGEFDKKILGRRILKLRQRKGLTQKHLAEMAGLSESALRSYELGDRNPKEKHLEKIARALQVRPEIFDDHKIVTNMQVIHVLFNLEDQFDIVPDTENEGSLMALPSNPTLHKALKDWGKAHHQLEAGEISKEEYTAWKDTYTPNIWISAISGNEIDDPYTGQRLQGDYREGAFRTIHEAAPLHGFLDSEA